MLCSNLSVTPAGRLLFAGVDLKDLADQYGTPLYAMDEDRMRALCRMYRETMREAFGEGALPLFASKAASFREMYRVIKEEGLGADLVSCGEIYTAHSAGFPMEKTYFHGNNKTDEDLLYAMTHGVGCIVVDGSDELRALSRLAARKGVSPKILLRITPGIDPHTFEEVATGKVDSKFGEPIATGGAMAFVKEALRLPSLSLAGFHCHVGSQVFDAGVFLKCARVMLAFIKDVYDQTGFLAEELNLGGGWGVRYTTGDPVYSIRENVLEVGRAVRALCRDLAIPLPKIFMEPGRSIVADAGLTLYSVGSVKKIPGYRNYVSVNGGMADNPRFALYRSSYTVVLPEKMNEKETLSFSVVGRCCESGDILQENVELPASVCRGDLLAVLTTGAYNFSMASHYNRLPHLPVIMLSRGNDRLVVRRETLEEIASRDL